MNNSRKSRVTQPDVLAVLGGVPAEAQVAPGPPAASVAAVGLQSPHDTKAPATEYSRTSGSRMSRHARKTTTRMASAAPTVDLGMEGWPIDPTDLEASRKARLIALCDSVIAERFPLFQEARVYIEFHYSPGQPCAFAAVKLPNTMLATKPEAKTATKHAIKAAANNAADIPGASGDYPQLCGLEIAVFGLVESAALARACPKFAILHKSDVWIYVNNWDGGVWEDEEGASANHAEGLSDDFTELPQPPQAQQALQALQVPQTLQPLPPPQPTLPRFYHPYVLIASEPRSQEKLASKRRLDDAMGEACATLAGLYAEMVATLERVGRAELGLRAHSNSLK